MHHNGHNAGNSTTIMEGPPCKPVRYCRTVGDTRKALQEERFPELSPTCVHMETHAINKDIADGWVQNERFYQEDLHEKEEEKKMSALVKW